MCVCVLLLCFVRCTAFGINAPILITMHHELSNVFSTVQYVKVPFNVEPSARIIVYLYPLGSESIWHPLKRSGCGRDVRVLESTVRIYIIYK